MNERKRIVESIAEAREKGVSQSVACNDCGLSTRTFQRWINSEITEDKRSNNSFTTSNALSRKEEQEILRLVCLPKYRDLTPNQIVPILAENGLYIASERTVYRLLKKQGMNVKRGRDKAPKRSRPEQYIATDKNQVWVWDITYLPTNHKNTFFYLYAIIDIWDRSVVGWTISDRESGLEAAILLHRTCIRQGVKYDSLIVHQDNGSPMISVEFLSALSIWGKPSFSRPGVSDDNAYAESFFRTAKYNQRYPVRFNDLAESKSWASGFIEYYNNKHRHSGIKFLTPMQRRNGEEAAILAAREKTYKEAKKTNPGRWSGNTRDWSPISCVYLNRRENDKITGQGAIA